MGFLLILAGVDFNSISPAKAVFPADWADCLRQAARFGRLSLHIGKRHFERSNLKTLAEISGLKFSLLIHYGNIM
jgi:hypothetical protein